MDEDLLLLKPYLCSCESLRCDPLCTLLHFGREEESELVSCHFNSRAPGLSSLKLFLYCILEIQVLYLTVPIAKAVHSVPK